MLPGTWPQGRTVAGAIAALTVSTAMAAAAQASVARPQVVPRAPRA